MKIKKNDEVLIIVGKDKGKTGKVEKALPREGKIVVTGINTKKKNLKPSKKNPKGGIIEFPGALNSSNVKLICPKCSKPVRVYFERVKDKKERKCKKCKEMV